MVDLQYERERVAKLTAGCGSDVYMLRCETLAAPLTGCLKRTTDGLAPSAGLFCGFVESLRCEAVKLYKLQVEAAACGTCKQEELARKQTKVQADALEKAATLDPYEALGMAFTAFLKKNKSVDPKLLKVDYMKMIDVNLNSPTLVEPPRSSSQPKQVPSPGAARGHNQKKGGKNKPAKNHQHLRIPKPRIPAAKATLREEQAPARAKAKAKTTVLGMERKAVEGRRTRTARVETPASCQDQKLAEKMQAKAARSTTRSSRRCSPFFCKLPN